MPEFETFLPSPGNVAPAAVTVHPMTTDDVEACARLAAAREGTDVEPWVHRFTMLLADPACLTLVATDARGVCGYGKAAFLTPTSGGGSGAPDGWYLTGLVVAPERRRRRIGHRLTVARLGALAARGVGQVWYFANARNEVSLALHHSVGFREVTRDFTIPGVTFEGGTGVLSCWDADATL